MSGPPPLPGPPRSRRPPPHPSDRRYAFLAGVAVAVVALGGLLVLGLFVLVFGVGGSLIETQVGADLEDNPVLAEHVGEGRTFDIEWIQSGMHPDNDTFVFRVRGSKGTGLLIAKCITVDGDHEDVTEGTIQVGGRRYDLFPKAP
jgi:hypothetical protein